MSKIVRLSALLAMLAFGSEALSWETIYDAKDQWKSIYMVMDSKFKARNDGFFAYAMNIDGHYTEAEHTVLAGISLTNLGAGKLSLDGSFRLEAVDLYDYIHVQDDPDLPIEKRLLPPPGLFAGLPDYSFALYDWIRKNRDCPVGKDINAANCHKFETWLGGATNSSHFGDLASRTYLRYHAIALNLADKAKSRRELFARYPIEEQLYRDFVLEIEHEALSFEGIGQHFFQDRWALGHMWNRWNGPDAEQHAFEDLGTNVVVGALTGLIHGAELMSNRSDPMNSAWAYNGDWVPSMFSVASPMKRNPSKTIGPYRGFGDDHLRDLFLSQYGSSAGQRDNFATIRWRQDVDVPDELTYSDYRDVGVQRTVMLRCLSSGWAEVISRLGATGSGFGAADISLSSDEKRSVDEQCLSPWATNFSMALGFITNTFKDKKPPIVSDPREAVREMYLNGSAEDFAVLARTGLEMVGRFKVGAPTYGLSRQSLVLIAARARARMFHRDFDGTMLAQAAFGVDLEEDPRADRARERDATPVNPRSRRLSRRYREKSCTDGKACAGSKYEIAGFLEPVDLDDLPDKAYEHVGRDKETMFLFYNKAHADHWCQSSVASRLFADLRDDGKIHACRYLGSRFWQRTDPDYGDGPQKVRLQLLHDGALQEVLPVCAILQPTDFESSTDGVPRYLHAGYVPMQPRSDLPGDDKFSQALSAWCRKLPVVDYLDPADDTVASVALDEKRVTITGENFGNGKGRVYVWRGSGDNVQMDVTSWSESEITFDVPDTLPGTPASYCLAVENAEDELHSAGHFVLRRHARLQASLRGKLEQLRLGRGGCELPRW